MAVLGAACGQLPPGATPNITFTPDALAPGNQIYVSQPSDPYVVAHPSDGTPATATRDASRWHGVPVTENPSNGDVVAPLPAGGDGVLDRQGSVRMVLGDDLPMAPAAARVFSGDGSTLVAVRRPAGGQARIDVFDADTLVLRRTISWPAPATVPEILDVDHSGSRFLVRTWGSDDVFYVSPDPVLTTTTTGTDPLVTVLPPTGARTSSFAITGTGRVVYSTDAPWTAGHPNQSVRSVGLDGSSPRVLVPEMLGGWDMPIVAELGTGRVLLLQSYTELPHLSRLVAVDDTDAATVTQIGNSIVYATLANNVSAI
jgi:hypothetical protein